MLPSNFEARPGAAPYEGQRVRVYRNLTRKTYSILDPRTGRVLGYSPEFTLAKATYKVSEAGRDRVRRTGRKTVHAFVEGHLTGDYVGWVIPQGTVHYNPRTHDTFTDERGNPAIAHDLIGLGQKGIVIY